MSVRVGGSRVLVDLAGRLTAKCAVARTAFEQAQGLQGYGPLGSDEGMLFPFTPPRAATFHMGSVEYPIDIVFADARGRIGRIVHDAQPGSRSRWSQPVCGAVVELQGGACARRGIDVGGHLRVADVLYDDTTTPGADLFPMYEDRFEDNRLPDEAFSEAMDQPAHGWKQQIGYQPDQQLDVGPNVRFSQIADPGAFVASIVEAMAQQERQGGQPLRWMPDLLNAGATESAVVTTREIEAWLDQLGLDPHGKQAVLGAAATPQGLQTIADGFVLAGLADTGRILGHQIVLFRGRKL